MIYDVPATTKSNHISDSMYHLDSLSSLKHSKSALSFLNAMCQMVRTVYAQLVWSSRCQLDQFNDVSVLQQLDGFSCFIFSGAFVELVVGIQTLPGNNRTSNTVKGITRNNISHLRRQFLLDIIQSIQGVITPSNANLNSEFTQQPRSAPPPPIPPPPYMPYTSLGPQQLRQGQFWCNNCRDSSIFNHG